jgi:hypothetical protein
VDVTNGMPLSRVFLHSSNSFTLLSISEISSARTLPTTVVSEATWRELSSASSVYRDESAFNKDNDESVPSL